MIGQFLWRIVHLVLFGLASAIFLPVLLLVMWLSPLYEAWWEKIKKV